MMIEWLSARGFRRCTLTRDLQSAKIEFAHLAPYVEYSENGQLLDITISKAIDKSLIPMFAIQLRRERI